MGRLGLKGDVIKNEKIKEVLKSFGNKNTIVPDYVTAKFSDSYYYLGENRNGAETILSKPIKDLEEDIYLMDIDAFLEKFPYEVGDSFSTHYNGVATIISKLWDDCINEVKYLAEYSDKSVSWWFIKFMPQKNLKLIQETKKDSINLEINSSDKYENLDEILLPLDKEIIEKEGKFFIKKKEFPRTFEECCNVLGLKNEDILDTPLGNGTRYYGPELWALYEIIICRDAYWKLLNNWEPVHESGSHNTFYSIHRFNDEIIKSATSHRNSILEFPLEEIRDIFYDNFENIIDQCKDFL